MLISVIIPVYNSESTIERAIFSIMSQDHKNYELILVDDGSVDGSYKLAERFSDKTSIKLIRMKINGGVNAARNIGLNHISEKSDYVTFLDSDDEFFPDALSNIRKTIVGTSRQYKDYCFSVIDSDGVMNNKIPRDGFVGNCDDLLLKRVRGEWVHVIDSDLVRKGKFKYDERVKNGFESLAYLDLQENNRCYYSYTVVRKYYIDNVSLTRGKPNTERINDIIKGYEIFLERYGALLKDRFKSDYYKTLSMKMRCQLGIKSIDFMDIFKCILKYPFELRFYQCLLLEFRNRIK
ncbi:glycosyltransferase family 2 protein [Vibrio cionasavignyae]|uniref:glycosyltransferase family 2 protein n=1 Tax=Vibrio cionasavignyae TaxID=2910252 RepID=UPI003D0B78DB